MRVAVNNFSAEQGNDGASVNVLTRSGTNNYHGSLGFFHTDNVLSSRTVFQNTANPLTGRVLPVSRRNELAGSIGGPVIRNRTFLFGSSTCCGRSPPPAAPPPSRPPSSGRG